ncbi:hypothetical protein SmJEL517_g06107 [Synchytrium microbalum]|uniref:C3H1-type domain-containing protein n=1 Tax=Synchytrium microbalum TaxID=1806994 RepID=A0A507BT71_9FUNG|nr:uncharacterized protein SmJEL517_g06107 [Synchytrium microbalum]TPX30309.1 hypothetical protein SmJEL517_g06107 [Synchytrium microbalum]
MLLSEREAQSLKLFLTTDLEHRSEADPNVLADYVLVLLKHDQPIQDLRTTCLDQLEDFLKEQTTPFVTRLFNALQSKEYMKEPQSKGGQHSNDYPPVIEEEDDAEKNFKHARHRQATLDGATPQDGKKRMRDSANDLPHSDYDQPPSKRQDIDDHRNNNNINNNNNSRGDPYDSRRSRPGPEVVERLGPMNGRGRFNNPNSNMYRQQGRPPNMGGWNQQQQGPPQMNGGDRYMNSPMRGGMSRMGGFDRGGPRGSPMQGGYPPQQQQMQQQQPIRRSNQRAQKCRDYEERGYCLRGDDCPFDHGADRIVMEDPMALFPSSQQPMMPPMPYGDQGQDWSQRNGMDQGPYRMDPTLPFQSQQRPPPPVNPTYQGTPGGSGVRGRLGGGREYGTPDNTTLVVDSIPPEKLNLDSVNAYFKKYGSIMNIKLVPGTTRAVIQFAAHPQAMMAFQDPEPVFANRFVRVFWMRPEDYAIAGITPSYPSSASRSTPGFSARPQYASGENNKPSTLSAPAPPATPKATEAIKTQSTALLTKLMTEQKIVLSMMEKAKTDKEKADLKSMFDNISRKLAELLEEGKAAASKAASIAAAANPVNQKQLVEQKKKEALDRELEEIQRSVATPTSSSVIESDLTAAGGGVDNSNGLNDSKKTPEEVLAELKTRAVSLGIDLSTPGAIGHGRGGRGGASTTTFRGRGGALGRGGGRFQLDLRPRTLLVVGFDTPTDENVRSHFLQFGALESVEILSDGSALVKYSKRYEAEAAMMKGIKPTSASAPLTMTWHTPSTATNPTTPAAAASAADASADKGEVEEDNSEAIPYGEGDDDDEESPDRHFRRG